MRVHFVCTGNLYRSRMAEAYLRSKAIPGLEVTSSGVLAEMQAVPDLDVVRIPAGTDREERTAIHLREAERTFERIAERVDALLVELSLAP
jgi:protein-tyrosine-phosphatase